MLHSKEFNALLDPADASVNFYADCGDFPYVIRAYYAFKRGLPFVANYVDGGRYTNGSNPTNTVFDNLSTLDAPAKFFEALTLVHSGNYRTGPDATDSFTYPIAINRQSLRPGMVFYSPEGHVALVAECRKDGSIVLADAHPDQSVTRITFGPKLQVRSRIHCGGFRAFRAVTVQANKGVWVADNSKLPFFSEEQYNFDDFHATIRARMSRTTSDPLKAFEAYIRNDTYQEILDRLESVDRAWDVAKDKPIPISPNIYEGEGDWESYSSPSRDLRLRISMLNIPAEVRQYLHLLKSNPGTLDTTLKTPEALGRALLELKEKLFGELAIEYRNSRGEKVRLTMAEIEKRLYLLSFDPNHAPELRWGASGDELVAALGRPARNLAGYREQQPFRNRSEKKPGPMTPQDADNPVEIPPHDISAMIRQVIEQEAPHGPVEIVKHAESAPGDGTD